MEKRYSDADGHPALNLSNPSAASLFPAVTSNGVASKIQMFGACISDAPVRTLERTLSNSKRQAQHEELLRLLLGCQADLSNVDTGSDGGSSPGTVQLPHALVTTAIDGLRELIQDSGTRSRQNLRNSSTEENSTNLVKPSAWATRERKYNADLASLRAQIEAKSEAAAVAAAELQIMQSGAGMEVLQQRLKEAERQAADSAREATELRLKCSELTVANNALTESLSNGGPLDLTARRGSAGNMFSTSPGLGRGSSRATPSHQGVLTAAVRNDSAGGKEESASGRSSSGGGSEPVSYSSNVIIEHLSVSRAKHLFDKNAIASAAAAAAAAAIAEQQAGAKRRSAAGRAATIAAVLQAQAQQQSSSLGSVSEQGSGEVKETDDSSSIEVNSLPWLQQELAETTAQLEQQQADNAILAQQLQLHQQDIASLTQEAEQQGQDKAKLDQLIAEKQIQITTLVQQIQQQEVATQALTQQAEQQKSELTTLTQTARDWQLEKLNLTRQAEDLSLEKEALIVQLQQHQVDGAEAVKAAKQQQLDRDSLIMQLERLQTAMSELHETYVAESQQASDNLQAQHTALLDSKQVLLVQAQAEVANLQQFVLQMQESAALAATLAEKQASEQQRSDSEAACRSDEQLREALSDATALRLALSGAETAAAAALSLQDRELASMRDQHVMSSQLEATGLTARLADSENALALLITEHAPLQARLEDAMTQSARLSQQLDQAIADKAAAALESASLTEECTSQDLALQASTNLLHEAQASLSAAVEQHSADLAAAAESERLARETDSKLAAELQGEQALVKDLQASLVAADERVAQLSLLMTAQQEAAVALQQDMRQLEAEVVHLRARSLEREQAVERLEADLVNTRAQSLDQSALTERFASVQQACEDLGLKLEAVQQEKQTLSETLQARTSAWESVRADLENAHTLAVAAAAAAAALQLQSAQSAHADKIQALNSSHAAALHTTEQAARDADSARAAATLATHNAIVADIQERNAAEACAITSEASALSATLADAVSQHATAVQQLQLDHQQQIDQTQAQHDSTVQLQTQQHTTAMQILQQQHSVSMLESAEERDGLQEQLVQLQLRSTHLTASLEEERTLHGVVLAAAQEASEKVLGGLEDHISELETKLQQLVGREAENQSQEHSAATQLQQRSETITSLQAAVNQHVTAMQAATEQHVLSVAVLRQQLEETQAQMHAAEEKQVHAEEERTASATALKEHTAATAQDLQLQFQRLLLASQEDADLHASELEKQHTETAQLLETLKSDCDRRVAQLEQQLADLRMEQQALQLANETLQREVHSGISALHACRVEAGRLSSDVTANAAQRCEMLQLELQAAQTELSAANKRHNEAAGVAQEQLLSREVELLAQLESNRCMLSSQVASAVADAEEARSALQTEQGSSSAALEASTARLQALHSAECSELHQREVALASQAVNQQRELEVEQKKVQQLRLQNNAAAERMAEMHAFISSSAQSQSKAKGGLMAFANFVTAQRQSVARLSSPSSTPVATAGGCASSGKRVSLSFKGRTLGTSAAATTPSPSQSPSAPPSTKHSSLSSGGYDVEPAGEEESGTAVPQTPVGRSVGLDMDDQEVWGMTDCSDTDQAALQEVLAAAGAMAKGR